MAWYNFDKKLTLMKVHYFLFNAGIAPFMIFGPTIPKQMGYSAASVGLLYSLLPIVAILFRPTCVGIADKYRGRRCLLLSSIAVNCICVMAMILMHTRNHLESSVSLLCGQQTYLTTCNERIHEISDRLYDVKKAKERFACQLSCSAADMFREELCSTWKVEEHCTKRFEDRSKTAADVRSTESYTFSFTAVEIKEHIFALKDCLYAEVMAAKFIGEDCAEKIVSQPHCVERTNATCFARCDSRKIEHYLMTEHWLKEVMSVYFILLVLIYSFNWTAFLVTNTITDTVCFHILGNEPHRYGYQRLFGALGFGIISAVAGWLTDKFSCGSLDKNYQPVFVLCFILLASDLFVAAFLQVEQIIVPSALIYDVSILFKNVLNATFGFWCLFVGFLSFLCWNFLFWHLEDISTMDDLKWSKSLQGMDSFINTIFGEIPFFFISGKLIQHLGHIKTMSMILFVYVLRLYFYSILSNPVWVLPIELLSGFTFSMSYTVLASYASIIASPGTESTVQGVFGTLFDCVGAASGGLLGGLVYYKYDGAFLFRVFSFASFFAFIVHVVVQFFFKPVPPVRNMDRDGRTAQYKSPTDAITILDNSY